MSDLLSATLRSAEKRILSVGSGDGSQQVSILNKGHRNIVTTFYDSEETVIAKYSNAEEHIKMLRRAELTVLFHVDATKLEKDKRLSKEKFDIIMFTFPHTGAPNYVRGGANAKSIQDNKKLIEEFLFSSQHLLSEHGEIQITLKTSMPYSSWSFPQFFEQKFQIEPQSQHELDTNLFPGYVHRSTKGEKKGVATVQHRNARVYVFGKKNKTGSNISQPTLHTISIHMDDINDDDITVIVQDILDKEKESMNVLEIRRKISESVRPDTRQLNRVLYNLESKKRIHKGPPSKKSKKPIWKSSC